MKAQKSAQPVDIVRAWKDPEYRASLSEVERAQLPAHPSGLIELENLERIRGGGCIVTRPYAHTQCYC